MTDQTSVRIRDRNLVGVGLAACAACCAAPVHGLLGIAGTGALATAATIAFTGLAFGLVVMAAAVWTVWVRRRRTGSGTARVIPHAPQEITLTTTSQTTPS
jgi:hypothetical protein